MVYKIENKREKLPNYQIEIADFCNIPIGNFEKLVPNVFDKEKYVLHFQNLHSHLKLGLKLKKYIAYYNSMNPDG